jgi:hypothetical protein
MMSERVAQSGEGKRSEDPVEGALCLMRGALDLLDEAGLTMAAARLQHAIEAVEDAADQHRV